MKYKKTYFVLVLLIILVGLLLRVNPTISNRDFWYDEAFTGVLLQQDWPTMQQMIVDDVHPPLYYYLSKIWTTAFGTGPVGIRSFSIFVSFSTLISIYWITARIFRKKTAIVALVIAALSPFAIQYAQEARMYALFGFFMLWALWFFYKALKDNKKHNWIYWGLFCGLSFYTHYLSGVFFISFYIAYVLNKVLVEKIRLKKVVFTDKNFAQGVLIILAFFVSWAGIFVRHASKGNLGWITQVNLTNILDSLQIFFVGHPLGIGGVPKPNEFMLFFDETSYGFILLVLMVFLFGISWMRKRLQTQFLLLMSMIFGTFILLIILSKLDIQLYVSRYLMPAALFSYILIAGLIVDVVKNKWSWLMAIIVYVFTLNLLAPIDYNYGWAYFAGDKEEILSKEKIIVATNPFEYTTARYYFGYDNVRLYNKENPQEDYTKWVVVDNEIRILDFNIIKNSNYFVVIDYNCDWAADDLTEITHVSQLSMCTLKSGQNMDDSASSFSGSGSACGI